MAIFGNEPVARKEGRGRAAAPERAEHPEDIKYREALARLARDAQVTPTAFEKIILDGIAGRAIGPDCITLEEVGQYPTLAQLPEKRQQHVAQCQECAQFLHVLSPQTDEIDKFIKAAVARDAGATISSDVK